MPFLFNKKDCPNGELVDDGKCNDKTNNEDCFFDGDDCCGSCPNTELCTQCAYLRNLTGNGYSNPFLGNGICDDETNTLECAYDGLDCCGSNATVDHCTECACHGKKIPIFFQPRINCICFFKRKVFVPFPNKPVLSKEISIEAMNLTIDGSLFREHYIYFCCFQLLILLDVIGQQKTHGHVVLAQTHVESSRVTVMEMRTVLEISNAELIIVLITYTV